MESCVWLRLDARPESAGIEVIHEPAPRDGASWFGPYLGWEPARLAAAGLLRLYPLRYAGSAISRTERELARCLGVTEADAPDVSMRIERVLRREPAALRAAFRALESARDRASERLMFEFAEEIQQQIRGLRWITQPQKLSLLDGIDGDFAGVSGSVQVVISLRGGRMAQRHVLPRGPVPAPGVRRPRGAEPGWHELAQENAELMERFADAGAVGPLGWKRFRT
jgi:excinuclease UvrABC nuclease subunit